MNCLSATLNHAATMFVIKNLGLPKDVLVQRLPLNRPNLTYAVRPLISDSQPWLSLNFLVPYDAKTPPNGHHLVFINNYQQVAQTVEYLDSRLHSSLKNKNHIKLYHSLMSGDYLEATIEDFQKSDGLCRILITTSALAAVSTDLPL